MIDNTWLTSWQKDHPKQGCFWNLSVSPEQRKWLSLLWSLKVRRHETFYKKATVRWWRRLTYAIDVQNHHVARLCHSKLKPDTVTQQTTWRAVLVMGNQHQSRVLFCRTCTKKLLRLPKKWRNCPSSLQRFCSFRARESNVCLALTDTSKECSINCCWRWRFSSLLPFRHQNSKKASCGCKIRTSALNRAPNGEELQGIAGLSYMTVDRVTVFIASV